MSLWLIVGTLLVAAAGSLVFSTLTYSLRELSRARLADYLDRRGRRDLLEPIVHHLNDLIFVTAVLRLLSNTSIVLVSLALCQEFSHTRLGQYVGAAVVAT